MRENGFADGRSKTSPDSEQIERGARMCNKRNSASVENERAKSESESALVYCERCDRQIQERKNFRHPEQSEGSQTSPLPSHLSQTILNRLLGRVFKQGR